MGTNTGSRVTATRPSTRRALLRGAGAGLTATALVSACGADEAQRGTSQKPAAPVEIEYWSTNVAGDTPEGKARYGVLELFAQRNPDHIKLSHGQSATSNALDKVKTAMAAGSPPNLAVFHQYWGSDLYTLGGLADVEDLLKGERDWARTKSELYPQLITANSWKGKLFGVPVSNSYFGMFFHRGRLHSANQADPKPGWTFEDMMGVMRRGARPPDVWGYNTAWQTAYQRMIAGSNGATFLNKEGNRVVLTSQENVDAVQYELDILKNGLMRPASEGNYQELLPTGGVLFQFAVPQRISVYRQQSVDFGTVQYPVGPGNKARKPYTIGSTYSFSIFKSSSKEKERVAALAAKFAAQKDGQLFVARTAVVPVPNRATTKSAEFRTEFGKDPEYWPFIELQPHFDPYPNFPKFQDAYNALSAQLGRVWRGEASPKEAMAEAERECQIALDASLRL